MNTLENLEMVLFDFDDTLCIHSHRSEDRKSTRLNSSHD